METTINIQSLTGRHVINNRFWASR